MAETGQGDSTIRNLRVPNALWDAAQDAVRLRGDPSLSHIMRAALSAYVAETVRMKRRGLLPQTEERTE